MPSVAECLLKLPAFFVRLSFSAGVFVFLMNFVALMHHKTDLVLRYTYQFMFYYMLLCWIYGDFGCQDQGSWYKF